MNSSKGSATTVVDKLPNYVKEYVFSGVDENNKTAPYGEKGYLPWADALARDKENDDLWKYDDATYANQDTYEIDGINKLVDRGKNGDPLIRDKAIPYIEGVIDGDYLPGTKAEFITILDNVIDKPKVTFEDILDEIGTSLYIVGDLSNSNLAKDIVEDAKYYDRISAFVKAQNYKAERRRQEHALSYSVEYGKQAVVNAEILRMAGFYQREYEQGELADAYKKEYDRLVSKVRRLEILGNAVRSLVGSQEAETRPYYRPSPIVGIMGGAMAGAAMGTMIAPGIGTGIGAAAGAIMGLLSGG
mgnify:CR=1 FL=1